MATTAAAPQTNGIPSSGGTGSQTLTQQTATTTTTTQPASQSTGASQPQQQQQQQPTSPTAAPRPRDARTLELLLTAQGVTSYENRVPLLLLDLAYRHTASILQDALHLSADPYTTHAGARPSASSGAAATVPGADATVSANAVQLAIASRLGYQFRGAGAAVSKDWLLEMARERNRTALPRVVASEWGVRLPSERFVLSGVSWGLRDVWAGPEGEDSDDDDDDDVDLLDATGAGQGGGDAMEGVEGADAEDVGGDGVEGGTVDDVFGDDIEDEEMAED